ncbi:hypothetical protein Dxin01_00806 [Deinococcus xinjiangensis]|uniref:Uncharacterized protein n=1 Tax=Deinococcus xinjiangensis TaxID=457454 RepID=A0ABP9V710_9DEIO
MIVQHAASCLQTPTEYGAWQAQPLARGMIERGLHGAQTSVQKFVLDGLEKALKLIPAQLAAEVDFFKNHANRKAEPLLRVRLHYAPKQTFSAMHLQQVRQKLDGADPRLLPTLLHYGCRAAQDVLPCFTPDTALALHSASHTFYTETDEEFADELRDGGFHGCKLTDSDQKVLKLARKAGMRTPSDVEKLVPYFGEPYEHALLEAEWPPAIQRLCQEVLLLEARGSQLPPYSEADGEASCEFLYPYYRESLLLDPFAKQDRYLSFTREMHSELQYIDDDELPIRTFILERGEDLDRFEQYVLAAPALQEALRTWLQHLYAYGEG